MGSLVLILGNSHDNVLLDVDKRLVLDEAVKNTRGCNVIFQNGRKITPPYTSKTLVDHCTV